MNVCTFVGRLVEDAVVGARPGSTLQVCTFRIVAAQGFGNRRLEFPVACELVGRRAEGKLPPMLTKGKPIWVTGEVAPLRDVSAGASMLTLDVRDLGFMPRSRDDEDAPAGGGNAGGQDRNTGDQQGAGDQGGSFDDDIPF